MKRSIPILFILLTVTVCGLLLPAEAGAQKEASGVTVKKDGDALVLIPREPGKVFVVLGCPRAAKGQAPQGDSPGSLPDHAGEQRIPVKEYSKIYVLEVRQLTEVDLQEPSGLQVTEKTADEVSNPSGKPCACDFPLPPGPFPLRAPAVNPGNPIDPVNPVNPQLLDLLVGKAASGAGA